MIGVFCAMDLILFYLFSKAAIDVPDYRDLGWWPSRLCQLQVFLYTLLGSVLMLLAVLVMYWRMATFIPDLMETAFAPDWQNWLWLAFLLPLPSKCLCGRCIHGCLTPMLKRRPPVRLFWPVCC